MRQIINGVTAILFIIGCATGCAYQENYRAYAVAQSSMAMAQGPLIEFHENGTVKSIGNPMMQMAQISMKPPTSEADAFFSWLTAATPFGAIFGIVGAMTNGLRGNTSLEERLKYDLYYIENWSPGFDVKILLKTIRALF